MVRAAVLIQARWAFQQVVAMSVSFVLSSLRRSYLPPSLMFFGKNTLSEEKIDCHFFNPLTVREDINFYNLWKNI